MQITIGLCAQTACLWEATAKKPGNVHPHRDFDDLTYVDFVQSAIAISPVLESALSQSVGETILACAKATRRVTSTNTNLGIILLLAPLAKVSFENEMRSEVEQVLENLSINDAKQAYEAIRLMQPGGMGQTDKQDIQDEPTLSLLDVMKLAADRDTIAQQYSNGYQQLFDFAVPVFCETIKDTTVEQAILHCYLQVLAKIPDSLIARKRGIDEAQRVSQRVHQLIKSGWKAHHGWTSEVEELDQWLCEDGHGRNPGTTADLIAATLFIALRGGLVNCDHPFH